MSRQHFFGGVDLLQEFPENQSYFEQTYQPDFEGPKPVEKYTPTDLGVDLFTTMQNEYKMRRKVTTNSPQALFDVWKVLNRSNNGKARPPTAKKEHTSKLLEEQEKHKYSVYFFAQMDARDVIYTLKKYGKVEEEDANISRFVQQRQSIIQKQEKDKKPKLNEKDRQSAQSRLYQKREVQEDPQLIETKQRNEFVEKVIASYKRENPEAQDFRYATLLKEYWNNQKDKIPGGKGEDFDQYFIQSMEYITEGYYHKNGFYSDDVNKLYKYWQQLPNRAEEKFLHYESEKNLKKLLLDYIQQKKDQENIEAVIRKQHQQQAMMEERQRLQNKVLRKPVQKTDFEEMAKPKDRLRAGKTLLELKKMYPNDRILRKMLLQEFRDTKVAKHSLEYDGCVDSDEENKVKMRHISQKGGVMLSLEELEVPAKMKEEEIAELFERHMDEYYSKKQQELRKRDQEIKLHAKQDQQMRKFIYGMAQQFLKLRKRRLEEKVPTQNGYLEQIYKQLIAQHKEATIRHFPHKHYGESKQLRKKSFPSSLKRYFFAAMKSYVRQKYDFIQDKQNRLGFWAPPNSTSMCVVHKDTNCPPGCNRQTMNQRVHQQSRMVKNQKLFSDKIPTSVWDSEAYMSERKNIMMTLSDAKECTFQPAVCSRMPERLKKNMLNLHTWATTIVSKTGTLKHFINQFGTNFKKVPMIYRYGVYKRAIVAYRKQDYRQAYQYIAEAFNIPDMKIIFRDPEAKHKKEHPIFNNQNLGIDQEDAAKQPHEDMQLAEVEYQEKAEYKFLLEVYQFIKKLENYEQQLALAQKNIKKMIAQDSKKSRFKSKTTAYEQRRTQVKDQMCPLGSQCPSFQTRWPNSNIPGVTPLGADCCFAHHTYELKFARELQSKKHSLHTSLKAIAQRLGGQDTSKAWNPGGNTLRICIGCPENALCSDCQLKKKSLAKIRVLQKEAKKAYNKIKEKPTFKKKREMMEHEAQNFNKKISSLSRATALYNKERYSEAFQVILKAVEIVKQEIEMKQASFTQSEKQIKKKLHIEDDMEITLKQVYQSTVQLNPDDKLEAQKFHMYAKMTGLDADDEPDTNKFINTQIELLYRKIEKALEHTLQDIDLMKFKIEQLEDKEDQKVKSKTDDKKVKKMCPQLLLHGKCEKSSKDCAYQHNYLELDLVPTDSKINHLAESIKQKNESLRHSKPPIPWVASSIKDQEKYTDTYSYDKEVEKEAMLRSKSKGTNRSNKSLDKTDLYAQDMDDIKAPIYERKRQPKY